jgi:hypothetical protein
MVYNNLTTLSHERRTLTMFVCMRHAHCPRMNCVVRSFQELARHVRRPCIAAAGFTRVTTES